MRLFATYRSASSIWEFSMERPISLAIGAMALLLAPGGSLAQSGKITEAAGGYTFEEAAEENSATSDFHSADGHLTFAVVTQTAGNGFFDASAAAIGGEELVK
jgi:simple sugar transport system substrate-binding protein